MALPEKNKLMSAFRNVQIGLCWTGGFAAFQVATWTTRDIFVAQQAGLAAQYYARTFWIKKQFDTLPSQQFLPKSRRI